MKCVVVALALLGCESENKRPEPPPRETPPPSEAKPDPRCLEKTQELAAFLTPLYRANASAEINMGWEPQ
ncbi:MAG TPA: hypothetical protein VK427_12680, partial [Kofleriaceae bacterium]|nr:hypothetical protein [Kofleriaceae bacterium]